VPKPKLTGVDRVPIGARDLPESASVPKPRAPTIMRAEQKDTLVSGPSVLQPPDVEGAAAVAVDDKHKAELALKGKKKTLRVVGPEEARF
jgi:hypothetical protein